MSACLLRSPKSAQYITRKAVTFGAPRLLMSDCLLSHENLKGETKLTSVPAVFTILICFILIDDDHLCLSVEIPIESAVVLSLYERPLKSHRVPSPVARPGVGGSDGFLTHQLDAVICSKDIL